MKKIFLLLSLFFACSLLYAQTDTAIRSRSASKVGNIDATEFYLRQHRKEMELAGLQKSYEEAPHPKKEALKAKMLVVLYELFDLSMMKQYEEALQLKALLQRLENHQDYKDKNQEINRIKESLRQVEEQIRQRENLRDEIVARRLQYILTQQP